MKDTKCECDSTCCTNIDWSKDNGYKYILDELKSTRAQIDEIIKVIEMRIEKDAIIDEVLNTDYPDEEDNSSDDKSMPVDDLIKAIALERILRDMNKGTRTYPWWSTYPNTTWL